MRKIFSCMLAALILIPSLPSHAEGSLIESSGGSTTLPVELTVESASVFSVTVPSVLPVTMTPEGLVITSKDAKITNNGTRDVRVEEITVTPQGDWELVEWGTDFEENDTQFAMRLNNKSVGLDGVADLSYFYTISPTRSIDLRYDFDLPIQSDEIVATDIAEVTVVVSWYNLLSSPASPEEWFKISDGVCSGLTNLGAQQVIMGNRDLVLPDSVTSIGDSAFASTSETLTSANPGVTDLAKDMINSIVINDGCTEIGDYAFNGMDSLSNVYIADSVTTIGDYAFQYCLLLSTVHLPKDIEELSGYMLRGCSSLLSITIPNRVSVIGECCFEGCSSLNSVILGYNVSTIENYVFSSCNSLTTIDIPSTITVIEDVAFHNCQFLETINIDRAENTVSGAPWGATNATINWLQG